MARVQDPVTTIMSTDVRSIRVGQLLSDARKIMTMHHVHHVPVVEGERLVGLISSTDILALGYGEAPTSTRSMADLVDGRHSVSEVMERSLVTIGASQDIRKAAELLSTGSFHAPPVVDAEGGLLGMVTSTDIARFVRDS